MLFGLNKEIQRGTPFIEVVEVKERGEGNVRIFQVQLVESKYIDREGHILNIEIEFKEVVENYLKELGYEVYTWNNTLSIFTVKF